MHSRFYKLLCRVVNIKPDEVRMALLLFIFFFLITAPHTIIKALRYADLLFEIGYQALPLAYLLAAVVTGLVVALFSKIQFKLPLQIVILSSLGFFIVTGLLFQLFINMGGDFFPYLYWIWAAVLVVVLMSLFGLTINEIFNPRQAKRLIGFCGSGGILGGIVGGLIGYLLTKAKLGAFLLPLACGLLFACIFVVRAIFILHRKHKSPVSPKRKKVEELSGVGFKESYKAVKKERYLLLIAAMVILAVIVSTFIDYQFSAYAQEKYNTKEALQEFFALFFGLLTVFAFFFQILLTGFFLKRTKGVRLTLLMVPLVLMIVSLGLLLGGLLLSQVSLFAVILVKGSDESLTFSLNQSVREILYIPVPLDLRYRARLFIDMFVNRAAKVIAAGLLFIYGFFLQILGIAVKEIPFRSPVKDPILAVYLSGGIIILTFLWSVLDLRIFREYIKVIKQKIPPKWKLVDNDLSGKIDVPYTKQIFDTLESKETSSALYAMHLYELLSQNKLTPEIRQMISERIDDVKVASIGDLFNAEGASWFPEVGDEKSLEDFIADIKDILSLEAYQELIQRHADKVMKKDEGAEISRMELAKAIGMMDTAAPIVRRLEKLIEDDSSRVARFALESAGKLKREEHLPAIFTRLNIPSTRNDAAAALVQYGPAALKLLKHSLQDRKKDMAFRKAVVSVLSRIGNQPAADMLMDELKHERGEMRREVIEALDFLRSEKKEIHLSLAVLKKKTFEIVREYCLAYVNLHGPEQKGQQKRSIQQSTLDLLFAEIFRLLGLCHSRDDLARAYQNLKQGTQDAVDYAVELLDNTLEKDIRGIIMPLIVDMPNNSRVLKFKQMLEKIPAK